jgi:TfoX/Sxy family transcriptional regulator of competence genes
MAYDHDLANRIREQLADQDAVTEKEMFGGIAFLLSGNMAVGVTHDDLMVRVGKDESDAALERPHTRMFDMTGRPMRNWILVAPAGVKSAKELSAWVERGVAFARSLPPKG